MRDGCVLIHVDLKVKKVFVFATNSLAVQASRLAGENSLEYFVHPSWVCACWAAAAGRRLANTHAIWRHLCLSLVALRQDYFVYMIDKKIEKFVSVLLHIVVKLFLLLSKSGDELLRRYRSHFLLLSGDGIESKTRIAVEQAGWWTIWKIEDPQTYKSAKQLSKVSLFFSLFLSLYSSTLSRKGLQK